MKRLVIVCCILGTAVQLHAQGTIVTGGITFFTGTQTGLGSEIHILHNTDPNTGYTGFNFTPQGEVPADTFKLNIFVDVGVRIFSVQANNPFTLQSIQANTYNELTQVNYWFPNPLPVITRSEGVPFYLGFYTGSGLGGNTGVYGNPLLGWGEFQNVNGVITMIGSGLEYGGSGIIVGTDTVLASVPEPSTFALFGLALPFLWRFRNARA
jgi:hypothetical protein